MHMWAKKHIQHLATRHLLHSRNNRIQDSCIYSSLAWIYCRAREREREIRLCASRAALNRVPWYLEKWQPRGFKPTRRHIPPGWNHSKRRQRAFRETSKWLTYLWICRISKPLINISKPRRRRTYRMRRPDLVFLAGGKPERVFKRRFPTLHLNARAFISSSEVEMWPSWKPGKVFFSSNVPSGLVSLCLADVFDSEAVSLIQHFCRWVSWKASLGFGGTWNDSCGPKSSRRPAARRPSSELEPSVSLWLSPCLKVFLTVELLLLPGASQAGDHFSIREQQLPPASRHCPAGFTGTQEVFVFRMFAPWAMFAC